LCAGECFLSGGAFFAHCALPEGTKARRFLLRAGKKRRFWRRKFVFGRAFSLFDKPVRKIRKVIFRLNMDEKKRMISGNKIHINL